MKRALINAIKIDNLKKLSKEDRCDIIKYLKEKHGYTNRSLGEKLNMPHSTIHDWVNPQRNERGVMKISISVIINRLKEFEAKNLKEISQLKELKKIIDEKIKNNEFEKKFNKVIGWGEDD
jgi:IS30 family transposase